ncbi:MAG: hypothetical protein HQ574_04390 [Chloroflexi bacterium]|nr:hypothetical protein [Chloroflexota bacterium]
MKNIPNLVWTPTWTSLVGCIHGCLKYLDIAPNLSWLFGGTGHAFIINMSQDGSCPSGPTAWNTTQFYNLGSNLGYIIEGMFEDKRKPGWKENQQKIWGFVKTALDGDLPVIGWELAIPEWYVINGYDEVGYYFSGPGGETRANPKPWHELGNSGIGLLEILKLTSSQPAENGKIIKDALSFAIQFNHGSTEWVLPEYRAGRDAYQVWIDAVRSGKAVLMGHAYNAAVWEECRRNGLAFLQEARIGLKGQLESSFNSAITAYSEVANQLKDLTELYPFFENNREEPLGENPRSKKAAEHIQAAMAAEADGMVYLEEIVEGLS